MINYIKSITDRDLFFASIGLLIGQILANM